MPPTVEELETKVVNLEAQMATALDASFHHGQEHTDEGLDPMLNLNTLKSVATESLLPATSDTATIYYVTGPPAQLFLIDSTGQRELGYSALAASTSSIVLTGSNQNIPGATLTLPQAATYVVRCVFDFEYQLTATSTTDFAAVGVLTNASDNEFDFPRAAVLRVPTELANDQFRLATSQQWIVTTTTADEVIKLMARTVPPTLGGISVLAILTDTTILASSFLGGGQTAATHQHAHSELTGVGTNDHHTKYTDAEALAAVPSRILTPT